MDACRFESYRGRMNEIYSSKSESITFVKNEPAPVILRLMDPNGSIIQINRPGSDSFMVKIMGDGTMEFGEGYTPDEAALIFWRALASTFPGIIQQP